MPLVPTRPPLLCLLLTMIGTVDAAPPQRVVTLGGAVTEIVFALDAGGQVIAIDDSSVYPPATAALPKLGYFRHLSAEPLLAMAPDLVLASEHAGPPLVFEQLAQAGARIVRVPDRPSIAGLTEKIAAIADALEQPAAGAALARELRAQIDEAVAHPPSRPPPTVMFLLSAGPQGLMAAGQDTAADALISLLGAHNAFAQHRGYAPASAEMLATREVDYVLVSARSLAAIGGVAPLLSLPGLDASGLGPAQVIPVDDLAALGFGPRLAASLRQLTERLAGSP